jgi:hypothetical protein
MYAPFVISGILEEAIANKIAIANTNRLANVLNEHLVLSNYGTGVLGIAFIYISTAPEDEIHQECFSYSRKNKELFIQMRLSYEAIKNGSIPDALQLMAASYLQTMQNKLPLKKIPNFDQARFVEDVQGLFEAEGWLRVVELA